MADPVRGLPRLVVTYPWGAEARAKVRRHPPGPGDSGTVSSEAAGSIARTIDVFNSGGPDRSRRDISEWYVTHKAICERVDRGKNGSYWKYRTERIRIRRWAFDPFANGSGGLRGLWVS